jgi:hypothetical protein
MLARRNDEPGDQDGTHRKTESDHQPAIVQRNLDTSHSTFGMGRPILDAVLSP